jgi:hypothetical protein
MRDFGRQLNQGQFNNSPAFQRVTRIANNLQVANHFYHAGLGQAARYTLGLPAYPQELQGYARARLYQSANRGPRPRYYRSGPSHPLFHVENEPGVFDGGDED